VEEAITKFPAADKLYMIKGQILDSQGDISGAREAYATGTRKVPTSVPLWLLASRLEEKAGMGIKARAHLERARHYNPKNPELWLESIRVEERQGSTGQAKAMMARGAFREHNFFFWFAGNAETTAANYSLARVPGVWFALGRVNLDGGPAEAQDSVSRCAQKVQQPPARSRRCRPAILARAQDRQGSFLVRASSKRQPRPGRFLGMVV
jgi:tetratricopeptide (TPR) repeat protein